MFKSILLLFSLLAVGRQQVCGTACPPSTDSLGMEFIERSQEELLQAIDAPEDSLLDAFFSRWQRFGTPPLNDEEPLIDTLYRLATDIFALNRLGARLSSNSETRYHCMYETMYYILPDTLPIDRIHYIGLCEETIHFSNPERLKHPDDSDIPFFIEREVPPARRCYPRSPDPKRALYVTKTYARIVLGIFDGYEWGSPIWTSRIERMAEWIPVGMGHWADIVFDFNAVNISHIVLNESRNEAIVLFNGNDGNIYNLYLSPDRTGRWRQVQVTTVGMWY